MAQKRMFSNSVVESDDFLEMPDSSQNLYFHLSMHADDDGFVGKWKSIMRMTGKKEDDLKILIAKSFLIPFDTGIIVIKHWRLNNYIQKDRYKETIYKKEKALLSINESNVYNLDTECIHSIDKNRLDEISIDNIYGQNEMTETESTQETIKLWEEQFKVFYEKYPRKVKKQDVKKWFKNNKPSNELFSSMLHRLEQFRASKDWQKDGGQYIPYPTTWLNQKRWEDEISLTKQSNNFQQRNYENLDYLYANQKEID